MALWGRSEGAGGDLLGVTVVRRLAGVDQVADRPAGRSAHQRDPALGVGCETVIHRKVIGGFRSDWGAEASAIRTSILTTARKQGQNLLDAFRAVAGPSPLQANPDRA